MATLAIRPLLGVSALVVALAAGIPAPAPANEYGGYHGLDGERVIASWYGSRYRGKPTASGELFDPRAMTAAHPSLPFGTLVEVIYPASGSSVVVRINDRGPSPQAGRGIDLSEAAARSLGLLAQGVGEVILHPLAWD